jgi:CheY-like chemotaxis protein
MNRSTLIHPKNNPSDLSKKITTQKSTSYSVDIAMDTDEFWDEWIRLNVEALNNEVIILDSTCGLADCKRIISHIRLSKNIFHQDPYIIWISNLHAGEINYSTSRISYSIDPNTLFLSLLSLEVALTLVKNKIINPGKVKVDDYSQWFNILQLKGSHQISNEWGATKLAEISGTSHLMNIQSNRKIHADIYFKFIDYKFNKKNSSENLNFSIPSNNSPLKIMMIDDNYDKGWHTLLKAVTFEINPSSSVSNALTKNDFKNNNLEKIWDIIQPSLSSSEYDIILLDLRLFSSESDENYSHTNINAFSGARILEKIKSNYPYISVIVFTASNKAWNLEALLNIGADGYFIKPSPEIPTTHTQLRTELNNFISLMINLKTKVDALRPFWKHIAKINATTCLLPEKFISGNTTIITQRIQERLRMFFGLLKRNFEDSEFNKLFYYSDIKLAFMTLWSCLNDIQYACYDKKNIAWITKKGKSMFNIQVESKYLVNIGISTSPPKALQQKNPKSNSFESTLIVDYDSQKSVYSIGSEYSKINDCSGSIGEQIAFLLLTLKSASITDSSDGNTKIDNLVKSLFSLKSKRNHLYSRK